MEVLSINGFLWVHTTPQEIDWLKKSSVPGFHQKIVSVNSDEILELDVTLELLEVRLIQITPLH